MAVETLMAKERVAMPDWMDCIAKKQAGEKLSALERFILDNEPAGVEDEAEFRAGLSAVLEEMSQ